MTPTLTLEDALEQREALAFALENDLSLACASALIQLVADKSADNLAFAQRMWDEDGPRADFWETVETLTSQSATACEDCGRAYWTDQTTGIGRYGDKRVGNDCCLSDYVSCTQCESYVRGTTTTEDGCELCESCLDDHAYYCEACDVWVCNDSDSDHDHDSCDCEAPIPRFEFPADGAGTVANDDPIDVTLPAGVIDDQGLNAIAVQLHYAISEAYGTDKVYSLPTTLAEVVRGVGPTWQTKQGNFTKRLSSALYKLGIKLPADALSDVGNIGRRHSSSNSSWHVAFTRRLNESASFFFHEESCWWGSYSASRCSLKSWGGVGLRTLRDNGTPTGRAWVQPLNADLDPTHDAIGARAYLVFNGYGDLSSYVGARIVAHLTGRTYRKISFVAETMYVNGKRAYLVADEATCEAIQSLRFEFDQHDQHDAKALKRAMVAA